MIKVCGVRLTPNGKVYMFDPRNVKAEKGDVVVVESSHGNVLGEVVYGEKETEREQEGGELKPVIRIATDSDFRIAAENEELARNAFNICKQLIAQQGLDMKLFRTEYTLDRSKALFYYVSEQRVDFRNLVKELAPKIKIRIEMVQVGPREHAKAVGGIGLCGRQFCCQGFMTTFEPVTIKMAKDQGLTSNPTKYSGSCGKLLCCIRHEEAAYEYAHGIMPKNGSLIMTEDGPGKIIVVNMLKETCTVKVGLEQNLEIKSYGVESVRQLTDEERAEYLALRKREKDEMEASENLRRQKTEEERSKDASGENSRRRAALSEPAEETEDGEKTEKRQERQGRQDRRRRDNSARKEKRGDKPQTGETAFVERTPKEGASAVPSAAGAPAAGGQGGVEGGKERGRNPKFRKGKKLGSQNGGRQNHKRDNRQGKWKKPSGGDKTSE